MTYTVSFTSKFFDAKPYTREPITLAPQFPKPTILSSAQYHKISPSSFAQNAAVKQCQAEYSALLDRTITFSRENSEKATPALSENCLNDIEHNLNALKSHICNLNVDFFSSHKEMMYGPGKEMFHEFDSLLQNDKIPLQKRLNAVTTMAGAMDKCSGGVLTAVQDAISSLKQSTAGIKGAVYRTKVQMMEALISEHVRQFHPGHSISSEVHFINNYFNHMAPDIGVPERVDPFSYIAKHDISDSQLEQCKEMVLRKINPSALTQVMADGYLHQIKAAQQVDVSQPVSGDSLIDVFSRSNDLKQAVLNNEFGEVPESNYLIANPETYSYHFARQPTLIAKHFIETLKEEDIVDYDHAISLTNDPEKGAIKMLGDLYWLDQGGQCDELSARDLLAASPDEMIKALNDSRVLPSGQSVVFGSIARHLLDFHDQSQLEGLHDGWLVKFAELFEKRTLGPWQIDPVTHLAAQFGCPQTLHTLIRHGADIEALDSKGFSPLMLAAHHGQASVVPLLLKAQVNTERTTPQGDTALMLCARQGHAQTVRALTLHSAANLNTQNATGHTALMLAAQGGHVDAVAALAQARADLTLTNSEGHTALDIARHAGHTDAANALEAAAPGTQETSLMAYAHIGSVHAIQKIIQQDRIDIDAQNSSGMTALMIAAQGKHAGTVDALIQGHANPNIQNHEGKTALHLAARSRCHDGLQALINAGGNVNLRAQRGVTAAMEAAAVGDMHALEALIHGGADVSIKNERGRTAAVIAKRTGHINAARLLETAARAAGETDLMRCVRRGDAGLLRELLASREININAQNFAGMTATMLAATRGRLDMLIALIDEQPDLTLENNQGQTAAMIANGRFNNATASIILEATMLAQQSHTAPTPTLCNTPLMLCAEHGHTKAVQALIQHSSADINTQNTKGQTALMLAAQHGKTGAMKALRQAGADPDLVNHQGRHADSLEDLHVEASVLGRCVI